MNDPAVVGSSNFTDEGELLSRLVHCACSRLKINAGVLFRLDPDLSLHRVKEGVTIPNGTSWSADNKTMYFTDSPTGKITAYPYNLETGEVSFSQGKPFFTCPYEGGVPDGKGRLQYCTPVLTDIAFTGHCQDEEGHFWVACFGTGKVARVDPQGQVVAEVEVPTRCVTCPTLCGTELFITTATEEEPEKYPWSKRYSGGVFKVDVGVGPKMLNKFKMPI